MTAFGFVVSSDSFLAYPPMLSILMSLDGQTYCARCIGYFGLAYQFLTIYGTRNKTDSSEDRNKKLDLEGEKTKKKTLKKPNPLLLLPNPT